ncbi:MAG: GH39 family glycosyl hydrolase [Thermoguttaceae bacterium]
MKPISLLPLVLLCAVPASADEPQLVRHNPDPYGSPRPAAGATHVPVATSFFIQLGFRDKNSTDQVVPDSVVVRLRSSASDEVELLGRDGRFAEGYKGTITPGRNPPTLAINIDGGPGLRPGTTYTVSVEARSQAGAVLPAEKGNWQFTTADSERLHKVQYAVDLSARPLTWKGGFFTGFCKPSFCTSASNRLSSYERMQEVRLQSPRAWSLQRDFSPTTMGHQPAFLDGGPPNVVRELETRRIVSMEPQDDGVLLRVEDFFGHQQYGIPSDRPLAADYHPGDEILVADGIHDARAKVVRIVADSPESRSLLVSSFAMPEGGWKIEYARPLPVKEDPDAPGLFPPGGCYLRKHSPPGTPHYYWGRLDKEWDIAVRQFGRRIVVNFADAPGDLAVDGRTWTYPKDYVELHQVVYAYTSHLIERYGDACLDFVWSIFNEPDLAVAFWRSRDWTELQKFYDYSTDAVLRSFEDHGYDSKRVFIGGLEIGAIAGARIEEPILKKFLCHCSPAATCEGELALNAAFGDSRLDGRRSRRVEDLCRAHDGKGSPCDFVSVHSYNAAPVTAAKLHRAKQLALELDAEYFAGLWVNSFESCPDWAPPPDTAAGDSYLGNGYFSTWCADVTRRQLAAAAEDARYGLGETILTFWPWPNSNFRGNNDAVQVLAVDDDGDGRKDRDVAVALPILHFLGLLARMGENYWVLPERAIGGHVVSGFASRDGDRMFLLVYSHDPADVQARSRTEFAVDLDMKGVPWSVVDATEYEFDKDHNSYFRPGRQLRDRGPVAPNVRRPDADETAQLLSGLADPDPAAQLAAVQKAAAYGELPVPVLAAAFQLSQTTKDESVRVAIEEAAKRVNRQPGFGSAEVARIQELSQLHVTRQSRLETDGMGRVRFTVPVAAGGANFVVLEKSHAD